jgi:hypothetical protein
LPPHYQRHNALKNIIETLFSLLHNNISFNYNLYKHDNIIFFIDH